MASMICSLLHKAEPCKTVTAAVVAIDMETACNVAAVLEPCCLMQTSWSAHALSGTATLRNEGASFSAARDAIEVGIF